MDYEQKNICNAGKEKKMLHQRTIFATKEVKNKMLFSYWYQFQYSFVHHTDNTFVSMNWWTFVQKIFSKAMKPTQKLIQDIPNVKNKTNICFFVVSKAFEMPCIIVSKVVWVCFMF